MGIFSNKTRTNMDSYCEGLYDSQLFHSPINGKDCSKVLFDNLFNSFSESEPVFAQVDHSIFEFEIVSLYLELYSLAFFDNFHDFNKAVKHSHFTYQYLKTKNRLDIWNNMSKYASVIAKTPHMLSNGQLNDPNSALGRSTTTFVNSLRLDLLEDCLKKHLIDFKNIDVDNVDNIDHKDKEFIICVLRTCNCVAADISSKEQAGARKLTAVFMQSFRNYFDDDYRPNNELLQKISSTTLALYKSFKTTLKNIDLRF